MNGEKPHVLILEDDDDLRELLLFTLEDQNYAVKGVPGAVAALNVLRHWPCQLVVSDVRLGGLDGLSCLKAIKERYPKIKRVVMTGYGGDDSPMRALKGEVDDYLYKPFDMETFQRVIARTVWSDRERAVYVELLQTVWTRCCVIWKQIYSPWRNRRLASVVEHREKCFRDFFLGVRSGGLSFGGALLTWDNLEGLEAALEQMASGKIEAHKLEDGYSYLSNFIASNVDKPRFYTAHKRPVNAVPRQLFTGFFQRLREGLVSLEQVLLAPQLRLHCTEMRGDERLLFDVIWGDKSEENTPWAKVRRSLEMGEGLSIGLGSQTFANGDRPS